MAEPVTQAPARQLSVAEYLCDEHLDAHCELVAGEVVAMAPVNEGHQSLVGYLLALLREPVEDSGRGRVLFEPFQVRVNETTCRAPDIAVVMGERAARVQPLVFEGGPDLVIEVASPSTRAVDRGTKFYEYEAAGVLEYWILDPARRAAEFYRLDRDGCLQAALPDAISGRYESVAIPGLWLLVSWLWERLPLREVRRQWGQSGD
ncbi:MAG: Uma2 family endonuclease [Fimbriimonadaceae bacterium]|nr:Uma2 family endonuclease [Fimbriimonadaceae bacterium]